MAYPYLIWAIIMILIPLAMIFVYAFTTGGNSVRTFIFTLDNFAKFFSYIFVYNITFFILS